MFLGDDFVKGGQAVDIRGRTDHGLTAGDAGYAPGQPIGSSQMARGKADHMAAAFGAGQHGGVRCLVAQQRRDFADGNSRRADEDVGVELFPMGGKPGVETRTRHLDHVFRRDGARAVDDRGQPQPGGDFPGPRQSFVRKGIQSATAGKVLCGQMIPVAVREVGAVQARSGVGGGQGPPHENQGLTAEARVFDLAGDVAHSAAQNAFVGP